MLRLRLDEQPAPTGKKDLEMLLGWLLDTLGLVRRRNDADTSDATQRPLHRLMRDHLLKEPMKGVDAKTLAEELGISMTALHHHLKGLQAIRLVTSISGDNGWMMHHLRCGSLSSAVDILHREAEGILALRLAPLEQWQTGSVRRDDRDETDQIPFKIVISEPSPLGKNEDEIDAFLNDLGLRGERSRQKSGEDLTRQIFEALLCANHAISLDEAVSQWGATRPRLTRTFDRFRSAGIVERVLRHDRLTVILWDALSTQYSRRGEEWLLGKGGLGRLDEKVGQQVVKSLREGKFDSERCAELFSKTSEDELRLTLNLLGGRLPYGYRLSGDSGDDVARQVKLRFDTIFGRLKRVASTLDEI
tara:strand:+ start:69 stop:1151 length:1083 start_codon:yes stop_codon:yes gene_type:complete